MKSTKAKNLVSSKRVRLVLAALTVLSLFSIILPGCSEEKAEPIHLKLVELPYIPFMTFYIAQEEGYFAEQGLEVELVKFTSVTQALPLLVQGDLDVAAGSINAGIFNAIAQNMNIKIVAGRDHIDPDQGNMALVVSKDLYDSGAIDSVSEVKDKQVFMPCTACIYDFAMTAILENAGLNFEDISTARMAPQDIVAAFTGKSIEVATVGSLQLGQIKSLGCAEILKPFDDVIPEFQVSYMMFGPTLLNDNPDAGKKFMIAYLKGVTQYIEGKTERNIEIAMKYLGMDRETLLATPWPPMTADARVNIQDVMDFQDWAYDQGLVDNKVSSEQLIDTSFVDYGNDVLGTASIGD